MQSLQVVESRLPTPAPASTRWVESGNALSQVERTADSNFALAAERLGLSSDQIALLRTPFREVKVSVPVPMVTPARHNLIVASRAC